MMEALAKTGAACNSLQLNSVDELEALVMTVAYCKSSSKVFSAVKVDWYLQVNFEKLFPHRNNNSNEDRHPISWGISITSQQVKTSFVKEDKPDNSGGSIKPRRPEIERSSSLSKSAIENNLSTLRNCKDFKLGKLSGKLPSL